MRGGCLMKSQDCCGGLASGGARATCPPAVLPWGRHPAAAASSPFDHLPRVKEELDVPP